MLSIIYKTKLLSYLRQSCNIDENSKMPMTLTMSRYPKKASLSVIHTPILGVNLDASRRPVEELQID